MKIHNNVTSFTYDIFPRWNSQLYGKPEKPRMRYILAQIQSWTLKWKIIYLKIMESKFPEKHIFISILKLTTNYIFTVFIYVHFYFVYYV